MFFFKQFDIDVIIEDEGLSSDEKPRIEAKLKEEFQKARELVKKRYEQDKLELDKLSEEEKKSLEEIKIYKFYPTHPDIPIKQFIVFFIFLKYNIIVNYRIQQLIDIMVKHTKYSHNKVKKITKVNSNKFFFRYSSH